MDPATESKALPPRPELDQFKKKARDLLSAWRSGDVYSLRYIRDHHPRFTHASPNEIRDADLELNDAEFAIAREHGFDAWANFVHHLTALTRPDELVSPFEAAVDAIVTGDLNALDNLLCQHPALSKERSTRVHNATLLHYVSANGIEAYRQKCPVNAVAIASRLLDAGAEVDASLRGSSTTLGLVASSAHAARAQVQTPLIELLLDHGANIEIHGLGRRTALAMALASHCPDAAAVLAKRGANADYLVFAASLGRIEVVRQFDYSDAFLSTDESILKYGAVGTNPRQVTEQALIQAAVYGRAAVVKLLLEKGVDPTARDRAAHTALHWAAAAGHIDIIRLLLEHGASLEARNRFGGSVLDCTVWFALHGREEGMGPLFDNVDYPKVIQVLIEAGARPDTNPRLRAEVDEVFRRDQSWTSE